MFFIKLNNNHLSFGSYDHTSIPYRWNEDESTALYTSKIPDIIVDWLENNTKGRYFHVVDRHYQNIQDAILYQSDINSVGYSWSESILPIHEIAFDNFDDALKFKLRYI